MRKVLARAPLRAAVIINNVIYDGDAVDARIVTEVKSGTGSMINAPSQVGGCPKLISGAAPADTDHDGMPDAWEQAQGLDPHNPADGRADADQDGYTNLEEHLHSLTE